MATILKVSIVIDNIRSPKTDDTCESFIDFSPFCFSTVFLLKAISFEHYNHSTGCSYDHFGGADLHRTWYGRHRCFNHFGCFPEGFTWPTSFLFLHPNGSGDGVDDALPDWWPSCSSCVVPCTWSDSFILQERPKNYHGNGITYESDPILEFDFGIPQFDGECHKEQTRSSCSTCSNHAWRIWDILGTCLRMFVCE